MSFKILQYTIGKNFTSRDNQGEFIFCYFPEVGEECEIHIKQDRTWWIKSQEGNSIYLNGEKLTKKVQLHFGDYVSFGINYSVVDDIVSFIERTGTRNSGKIPIFLFEVVTLIISAQIMYYDTIHSEVCNLAKIILCRNTLLISE